jgi:hypothetical protein
MTALDFAGDRNIGTPPFFSANTASVSRILSGVAEVQLAQQEKDIATIQTVVYRLEP